MALRADFEIINFSSHLGDKKSDIKAPWATFHGDVSPVKNFFIGQRPVGAGYLLVQAYNVNNENHRILVNGIELGGFDIPTESGWQTWMDVIQVGVLKQGNNTIQIKRTTGGDNFIVANVTVHWREVV